MVVVSGVSREDLSKVRVSEVVAATSGRGAASLLRGGRVDDCVVGVDSFVSLVEGLLRVEGRRISLDMGVVGSEEFGNGSARTGSVVIIGSSTLGFGCEGGTIQ